MQIIRQAGELETGGRKVCLAIGMFDGVHLGHQQVLRQTIQDAQQHHGLAVAVTFDRHPASVLAPAHAPALIYNLPQKLETISALGLQAALLLEFTAEFGRIPARDFIQSLKSGFRSIFSICVGSNFHFGHGRGGNVEVLKTLGQEFGFQVHGLAAVSLDGKTVSSTRVREAIRTGDLDAAGQMLGRSYTLRGKVVRGEQLGSKLGFPTANLECAGLVIPPNGVYAACAKLGKQTWPSVVNIGVRPTVSTTTPTPRVEAHLLDVSADLYGAEIELLFLARLRDEQRFSNVQELKSAIARDIEKARPHFE